MKWYGWFSTSIYQSKHRCSNKSGPCPVSSQSYWNTFSLQRLKVQFLGNFFWKIYTSLAWRTRQASEAPNRNDMWRLLIMCRDPWQPKVNGGLWTWLVLHGAKEENLSSIAHTQLGNDFGWENRRPGAFDKTLRHWEREKFQIQWGIIYL